MNEPIKGKRKANRTGRVVKKSTSEYRKRDAIQRAIEYGIDITLLYERLSLTPTQRMERHEEFLKEIAELRRAGERKHGKF